MIDKLFNLLNWKFSAGVSILNVILVPLQMYNGDIRGAIVAAVLAVLMAFVAWAKYQEDNRPKTVQELIDDSVKISYNFHYSDISPRRKLLKEGEIITIIDEKNGIQQDMRLQEDEKEGQPLNFELADKEASNERSD